MLRRGSEHLPPASAPTRLEASGLITAERIGNQKHYRANQRSPVFEPLRELVLRTTGLADVLRKA